MRTSCWTSLVTLAALCGWSQAQDVVSGPTKGEKVPALKVFDATGEHKDKDIDYAAERKDKPTIYILVDREKFSRPINRFMKTLDGAIKKESEDAYVVVVMLTDKPDDVKTFLPRVQQSVQYENTALTCFVGEKEGPKEWTINSQADVTVVIANKAKVAETFGYNSINETEVRKVLMAFKKAK
jgi:hypothetical protein